MQIKESINHQESTLESVRIDNERYYKISDVQELRPFLMTIVSNANHWMFISSNGGLTAGRVNANQALFPYETDDRLTATHEYTGSKTIIRLNQQDRTFIWEPFSNYNQQQYSIKRNLYKNKLGNKVVFEEVNEDLQLAFQYRWLNSNKYGFIRQVQLKNLSNSKKHAEILDGLLNIIPNGVGSDLQSRASNLVDAYKRNELVADKALGIYALSAIIVDKAEPSESLKANIAWSLGLDNPKYLLSALQLDKFRKGESIEQEVDVKAEKGAYLVVQSISLESQSKKEWFIGADVNKNQSQVRKMMHELSDPELLLNQILNDVKEGSDRLKALVASSDGLQNTNDELRDSRHYSNVLFNIMRGGIFDQNYTIHKEELEQHLLDANEEVYSKFKLEIQDWPATFTVFELQSKLEKHNNPDFIRLCTEYLPLGFSRRHGDPSRPWNVFNINTHDEDTGKRKLEYEGNWRDIFQNWEALVHSYPGFIDGMIYKFLNASTFDGYNPYRVTNDGFDWEVIEPDDPWSYIGYWGDHQIIYLLKFFEFIDQYRPGKLSNWLHKENFVYANVPYRIKNAEEIFNNPKDTIEFDEKEDERIRALRDKMGFDGALQLEESGAIYHVNLVEKILATVLAKLSNFIPEAGIWMNTQRPEWNDANNALVGNGVSMVTLYYLRRFMNFFNQVLLDSKEEEFKISGELLHCYKGIRGVLEEYLPLLESDINDSDRATISRKLSKIASDYRNHVYNKGFWGKKRSVSKEGLIRFAELSLQYCDHTIDRNQRKDGLYHAYNLISFDGDQAKIEYLSEMLEGQVAILSAKYLNHEEVLNVLDALKASELFRHDQYSYLLYPNKNLPGFLSKNNISKEQINTSILLQKMLEDADTRIVNKDLDGGVHFNADFRNADLLSKALKELSKDENYSSLLKTEVDLILNIYEEVFNHKAFTGRSGTFFGYEGLGSIYWHMVSKLLLATQECCFEAIKDNAPAKVIGKLLEHYYEIQAGIGVHKKPNLYGAFPTDAYSHTPGGKGAQQPGMTGQVKEDILCRLGELGLHIRDGKLTFMPVLLRENEEFLSEASTFTYVDINQELNELQLTNNQLGFTCCQVPIVYETSNDDGRIEIELQNGEHQSIEGLALNEALSNHLFHRTGEMKKVKVHVPKHILK